MRERAAIDQAIPAVMRTLPDGRQLGVRGKPGYYVVVERANVGAEWTRDKRLGGPFNQWGQAADWIVEAYQP